MDQITINDLRLAQKELITHQEDLKKCADDLKVANENLSIAEVDKEKMTLQISNDIDDMMFTISHRVRTSIAKILGISHLLYDDSNLGVEELRDMLKIIIESAESLNNSTEELSKFIRQSKNQKTAVNSRLTQ